MARAYFLGRRTGVYDLVCAKLANHVGLDALYMTGFGILASYLGEPIQAIGDSFVWIRCRADM